jgi:hypothetical protein
MLRDVLVLVPIVRLLGANGTIADIVGVVALSRNLS